MPDAVFMTPQAIAITSSHVVVVGSKSNAEGLLGPIVLVRDDAGATWHAGSGVPPLKSCLKSLAVGSAATQPAARR